tara:strand:+ start:677 stop:1021 length:345 start_codon:yes stop_codon:yes gene_type:complete
MSSRFCDKLFGAAQYRNRRKSLARQTGRDHIQVHRKVWTMQNIRSFFLFTTGVALFALAALLTASLTVAFMGIVGAIAAGRLLSARLKPVPVKAKAQKSDLRVWNDGRGTIIDL